MSACGFDTSPRSTRIENVAPLTGDDQIPSEVPKYGFGDGLVYSIRTATSLLRAPEAEQLTAFGHVVEVVLRFAGPLLLALALLALRGRVKR